MADDEDTAAQTLAFLQALSKSVSELTLSTAA
jgi:hypothetical protein